MTRRVPPGLPGGLGGGGLLPVPPPYGIARPLAAGRPGRALPS